MKLFQKLTFLLFIAGLLFYSCKKDSQTERTQITPPTTSTNKPPIAVSGPGQTIILPTDSVQLEGTASHDPDGIITSWLWKKISGPSSFAIVNPGHSITKVKNLAEGIYLFELKVTDNGGLSATDTVRVTVERPLINPNFSEVFIAGLGKNSNGKQIARVWNNSVVQNLSDGQNDACAYSVAVSGNDVYVAGFDGVDAILWKNGVAQNLGNGEARSVCVSGNDVYVAGKLGAVATLWKNGVAQSLGNGGAVSVSVSGNDVYVAGWLSAGSGSIVLWKNGIVQALGNSVSEGNELTSVFASGSNVYMTGNSYFTLSFGVATLWENGVENFLGPNEGRANSVFVSGSDVYVAGMMVGNGNDAARAIIWKNGVATNLTDGQYEFIANSVFVSNNSIYATGGRYQNTGNDCSLWVNGMEYIISGFTQTNSVFVQ